MSLRWLTMASAAGILILHAGCATQKQPLEVLGLEEGVSVRTITVDGEERPYALYIPQAYTPERPWPLILFLHGIGQRGDDGLDQTSVGIGPAIREHPERFPCLVLMPQCPERSLWPQMEPYLDAVLKETLQDFAIDRDRVYLTGISMGAFGAWNYIVPRVNKFAAMMPLCGAGNTRNAPALANLPIWMFHGADDGTVPVRASQRMAEALEKAGNPVRYTEYPKTGHNCWDKTYGDPEVIQWLLDQRKGASQ